MATKLTLTKITVCLFIILTICGNTNAKKKYHKAKESSNLFKGNKEKAVKAVTFLVIGKELGDSRGNTTSDSKRNTSRDLKTHKSRDQHALEKSNSVTKGNDTSYEKTESNSRKKISSSNSSKNKRQKDEYKHSRKENDKKSYKTKSANAVSRQNIANEISKIDDVQGAYKQGISDDDELEKVKMIDNGELSDYFHALNGDDKSLSGTSKVHRHDNSEAPLNQDNEYPEDENSNSDTKSDEQILEGTSEYKMNRQHEVGPGYEVFSDNPDESDSDDFYNAIKEGKSPAEDMKRIRPTKSHFGRGHKLKKPDQDLQLSSHQVKGEDQISKYESSEEMNNEDSFPQQLDQNESKGQNQDLNEQHSNIQNNDVTSMSSQDNENQDQNIMDYPYPIDNAHAQEEGNLADVVNLGGNVETNVKQGKSNASKAANSTKMEKMNKTDKQENAKQNEAPEMNETQEAATESHDYADSKEGQAPSNAYNQFLVNPFFNPFDLFGLNRKPDPKDNKEDRENKELFSNYLENKEPKGQGEKIFEKNEKTKGQQYKEQSAPLQVKGTRIQGGKIIGGTITGGLIEGGEIRAGSIEGGTIKGGYVEGGKFRNGTMEGGIFHDGLIEGGHLVNGSFEGGLMRGGNVYGGKVKGGYIEGGDIKGGVLLGGSLRGGSLEGGVMRGGEVKGGSIRGGKMEGGTMTGGSVEGGVLKFGKLSGGIIKAGTMLGGEMTNGSIEGGILKGGSISGGVLRGGVMEKGQLKGGVVLAGKINGGIIEGGVIEGGEIGDGVVIKGGRINATILAAHGNEEKEKEKAEAEMNENEMNENESIEKNKEKNTSAKEKNKDVDQPSKGARKFPPLIIPEPKLVQITDSAPDMQQNLQDHASNLNPMNPAEPGNIPPQPTGEALQAQPILAFSAQPQGTDTPEQFNNQDYRQTTGVGRDDTAARGKHHIVFDGVSFDIPDEGFSDLIRRINGNSKDLEKLIDYSDHTRHEDKHEDKHDLSIDKTKTNDNKTEKVAGHQDGAGIKPEDIETRLSPTKSRSVSERDGNVTETLSSKIPKSHALRPSYHWSLSNIIGNRIPGSPGAAMISHGHVLKTRGGLSFNGEDAWLGGGDFAGGCISAPDKCEDGFSFEMTLKTDKDSFLKSNDMRYIVDTGASTFNSKGFSLYTLHGKLRADIAIPNDSLCLETPLETDRWQDVLVTWKKDKGLKLYLNCEPKGHTTSSEHCLGCRSPGCHVTDVNTQLMIGRPNYSPHFHCTKFESGDISFWEKYLDDQDVNLLCGRGTVALQQEPSTSTNLTSSVIQPDNPVNPTVSMQQAYSNYQQNDPITNQQSYQQPNTAQLTSYPAPYPAPYTAPLTFLKPGTTYHFTEYIPGTNLGTQYGNQMSQGYYPAAAPAPSTENAQGLYSSGPLYVPGAEKSQARDSLASTPVVSQYFSPWGHWSACSETCGYGVRARRRVCQNPQILLGGKVCSGPSIQHGFCFVKACPGTTRSSARKNLVRKILRDLVRDFTIKEGRKIHSKLPEFPLGEARHFIHSARDLESPAVKHGYARLRLHAVDGHYGSWSPWGQCDRSCGRGAQVRTRLCNNPPPGILGRPCIAFGPSVQVRRCNILPCPVNGGFSNWSQFSSCSKSCGPGGIQFRVRTCTNPSPSYGGKKCIGSRYETKPCRRYVPCPVHARYSPWGPWSGCDADCGGGVRERMRQCISPSLGRGEGSCASLGPKRMTQLCNLTPCDDKSMRKRASIRGKKDRKERKNLIDSFDFL